jgi:hypothetical protein
MVDIINALFSNVNGIELLMFIGAIIFFAARVENNNKSNKELISAELKHVINLMEINHNNLREDIGRLERKQEESNKIKERLAMQEVLTADIQAILKSHLAQHEQKN